MQIFSPSHIRSFLDLRRNNSSLGFTLIELLISAAIIGIVSAIVLMRYSSFDSTVLLKSAAYEVALTLREAQVKSVSVSRSSVSQADRAFDYPYGVSFTPGTNAYSTFRYEDTSRYPRGVDSGVSIGAVSTSNTQGTIQISDLCIKRVGRTEECNLDRLDISFRRPEFKSLFFVDDGAGSYDESVTTLPQVTDFESARIELSSSNGGIIFEVNVGVFGQISVAAVTP